MYVYVYIYKSILYNYHKLCYSLLDKANFSLSRGYGRKRGLTMPLNLAESGKIYTIHRIGGQENERHHLENLGLVPGQELRLISEFHGYYIVSVKDTRIGIEKHLAQKVILVA